MNKYDTSLEKRGASTGADLSAGAAINPNTDTVSTYVGAGDNSGKGDAEQKRAPRPLKVRAKAVLAQLKGIDKTIDDKVALDRSDRAAKIVAEIDKTVTAMRADAVGKPGVSQKKTAVVIRELLALRSDIQGNLDTLEDGRLALTDEDLAILKG